MPDESPAITLPSSSHMRATLLSAAEQFEYYERQHRAKGTPDGLAKAEVNRLRAAECRAAAGEEPHTVERSLKNLEGMVADVLLLMKEPPATAHKFEVICVNDENVSLRMNGKELIVANHDEDGWNGMQRMESLFRDVMKRIGAVEIETECEGDADDE